ncbi:MAG: nucleotidyltransferase family protein [Granulosicoccus sp.]
MPSIGGLILAAGFSQRAGRINKLLVEYKGESMLSHAANGLAKSRVENIVAVTGHEHETTSALLLDIGIESVYNPAYASGLASSLSVGLQAMAGCDAVVVCLGDMPHVTCSVINDLIDGYNTFTDRALFVPVYQAQRGNPVMIAQRFFEPLIMQTGDRGARRLMSLYPDKVCEIEVDCAGVLKDYDTQAELNQLL